jgi:hypothetical protein
MIINILQGQGVKKDVEAGLNELQKAAKQVNDVLKCITFVIKIIYIS